MTDQALAAPRDYLQAQIRWQWGEVAFWLATLLPFVLTPPICAGEPDRDHRAVCALARSDPRLLRHRLARPRRLFRRRRLHGRAALQMGFRRAAIGACPCRARRRHIRLSDELHHRALPASGLDHAHARACAAAAGNRQQRKLAHRRLRWAARHPHLADFRRFRFDLYGYTAYVIRSRSCLSFFLRGG